MTKERTRRKRETLGDIQRSQTADLILARIVGDLHRMTKRWADADVDDRNTLTMAWREHIRDELEAYF